MKQNDTVKNINSQIIKKINRLILLPNESFIFFSFLNDNNYKINMNNEENFLIYL